MRPVDNFNGQQALHSLRTLCALFAPGCMYCIKIGNVQIGNAQIGNVQIGNAQIGNIKLGNAEIGRMEWPFSATVVQAVSVSKIRRHVTGYAIMTACWGNPREVPAIVPAVVPGTSQNV